MQDDMSWLSNEKYEAEEAKGCKNHLSHLLFSVYGSTWISGMAAANNFESLAYNAPTIGKCHVTRDHAFLRAVSLMCLPLSLGTNNS